MLVLTRRTNESIMIGDDVEVFVVAVTGDQVKIGIRAPRAIPVYRKEIYEEIQKENIRAAQIRLKEEEISRAAELLKGSKGGGAPSTSPSSPPKKKP